MNKINFKFNYKLNIFIFYYICKKNILLNIMFNSLLPNINLSIYGLKLNRKIFAWFLAILIIYIISDYSKNKNPSSNIIEYESFVDFFDNNTIYDEYYANLYDKIFYSEEKNLNEIRYIHEHAISKWKNKEDISILDLGCGTGKHLEVLSKKYKTTGLDKSQDMIAKARKNLQNIKYLSKPILVNGDITNSDLFDGNKFSHLMCMFFTFYYIQDKRVFFKNCNYWLKKDGILCLHIVNRKKFDPILDKASPFPMFSLQRYSEDRPSKSVLIFNQFRYETEFKFNSDKGTFTENFKFFNKKNQSRNNIHTFYMPSIRQILSIARQYGFKILGNSDLTNAGFEYQYIFFMQKK